MIVTVRGSGSVLRSRGFKSHLRQVGVSKPHRVTMRIAWLIHGNHVTWWGKRQHLP